MTDELLRNLVLRFGLQDMEEADYPLDALVCTGDLTDHGEAEEWENLADAFSRYNPAKNVILAQGNHDTWTEDDGYNLARDYFLKYSQEITGREIENEYYSTKINGYTFIVLASEDDRTSMYMSDAQLAWLEVEMKKAAAAKIVEAAAAELAVPDIFELKSELLGLKQHLSVLVRNMFVSEREKITNFEKQVTLLSPVNKIQNSRQELSNAYEKIVNSMNLRLNDEKNKLSVLSGKLNALSPLAVLSRGYSITYNNKKSVMSVNDIKVNDNIKVKVTDGAILATVTDVKGN